MYDPLLDYDQMSISMKNTVLFRHFTEANRICFPPTYKFEINTNEYETELKRVPSFTDRIIYRNKRLGHIINYQYNCVPEFSTSDHKPVFALFDVQIRHGRDDIPMNLGLFNREVLPFDNSNLFLKFFFVNQVYIEGLRRRAVEAGRKYYENHDCSIS